MKKALGMLIVFWVAIITIAMAGITVYAEDAPSQEEYTYIVTERDGLSFETHVCLEYLEPMYALEVGEECFDNSGTRIKERTKSVPGAFFKASAMASTVSSGRCGDSITYVLDSNGKLTLKGVGATWNFRDDLDYYNYHECPWDRNQITSLEIGEGITVIGADFMAGGTNLTKVTFPSTLKSIGSFAFMQCENLSDFTLPAGLESIYQHAFYGCDSLTSVTIPGRVTFLDGQIFAFCKNLKSATIDFDPSFDLNTFVYCNNSPYFNCPNVTKFIFPEGMTDTGCFDFCDSLESIVLPASINNLKDDVEQESYFCRCPNLKYIFYLGTETQFQKIPGYETAMQFKLHFNAADHTLVIDKAVDATCKSVGKTAGSHCSICGMVLVAQQTIPMKEHADLDGDGIFECCDNSVNIEEGKDSCICHATGFKAYIYMLIRIIWKLFKINETCVCGVKHY